MKWYDAFALVYDLGVEGPSRDNRQEAVRQLRLEPGLTALDVACGTGLNLPLLARGVGPTGTIVGTDYSAGMLARAARRVRRNRWTNVHLVEADARTLARDQLPAQGIHRVLCTLGFSVLPD